MYIIPNYYYVLKYRDSYVPTDLALIQKCKQIADYKICKRNQPNIKLIDSQTCESSILKRYSDVKCNRLPYLLHRETFISVINRYIIIPLETLRLDISCKDSIRAIELTIPELLSGQYFEVYNNYDTLDLNVEIEQKFNEWINVTYVTKFDRDDISKLKERLIQLPKQIKNEELRQARINLDDTENILSNISNHRRLKTWKETSLEWIQYLGYGALILGALFTLYKLGILDCIKLCIPKRLCLFCVETIVETVVNYSKTVQP